MSLVVNNTHTIDNLVQSSSNEYVGRLEWIPYSEFADITSSPMDAVYYAVHKPVEWELVETMLLLLGSDETCTPTLVSEFARTYSLPTHKYNNDDSDFRRYKRWLEYRNGLIKGFTKYDGSYYMVADRRFFHCYSS